MVKECNPSFRSGGPKGRNRKECCSSRLNVPVPPTVDWPVSAQIRFPNCPNSLRPVSGKLGFNFFYSGLKPENHLSLQSLRISPKQTMLCVDYPPAGCAGPAPPREVSLAVPHLSVRAHVAPKRLRRIHTARRRCALRLYLPLACRFSKGRTGDAFYSVPVPARWPATNPPTHTGFSALPLRNPSTPAVLHKQPPLCPLDFALCSPARS